MKRIFVFILTLLVVIPYPSISLSETVIKMAEDDIDLSGYWEGYLFKNDVVVMTAKMGYAKFKFSVFLKKTGDNKYAGIANYTVHKDKIETQISIRPEGKYVYFNQSSGTVTVQKFVEEAYREVKHKNHYFTFCSFEYTIKKEKGKLTLNGWDERGKIELYRKSDVLTEEQENTLACLTKPALEISKAEFVSATQTDFISYPCEGIISFDVINNCSGMSPVLGMSYDFSGNKNVSIVLSNTINGQILQPGQKYKCMLKLKTDGPLTQDSVSIGLIVKSKSDESEIVKNRIFIPVKK